MGYNVEGRRTDLNFRMLDQQDWPFVDQHLHLKRVEDSCGIVATSKGEIMGMSVYDNWSDTGCHGHHILVEPFIMAQGWLEVAIGYPFSFDNIQNVWGLIPEDNHKAIQFSGQIGSKFVTKVPDYWSPGLGCIVMQYTRAEWSKRHGQQGHGRQEPGGSSGSG